MGNHSRRSTNRIVRNTAAATAVAAGATAAFVTPAVAAEVNVPFVGNVSLPGEAAAPLAQVPGADQLSSVLPSEITGQAGISNLLPSSVNPVGQQIVDIARSKTGSPYVWGAAGPDAFDCSGFTSWVYAQVGKSIPRTSQAQAAAGQKVAISDLQPGDIVAFYGGASHVGIYVGNGTIIDALQTGTPVGERPLNYMPIHSAFRF